MYTFKSRVEISRYVQNTVGVSRYTFLMFYGRFQFLNWPLQRPVEPESFAECPWYGVLAGKRDLFRF